jgi:hypothetical protein
MAAAAREGSEEKPHLVGAAGHPVHPGNIGFDDHGKVAPGNGQRRLVGNPHNVKDTAFEIDGVKIEYKILSFSEFFSNFNVIDINLFNDIVIKIINSTRTPAYVRNILKSMAK